MSLFNPDVGENCSIVETVMNSKKYLWVTSLLTLLFLGGVGVFNYVIDPMCYYHCSVVDTSKRTQNVYYQAAQTAVASPDAEILILGSSRGETTPSKWIEDVTGQKTINLSIGGAEILLKIALLNAALDAGINIKKVIWIADYFELVPVSTDIKTKITPALQKHIGSVTGEDIFYYYLGHLQRLIDHNSLEASFEQLKGDPSSLFSKGGNGSSIDYVKCKDPRYLGSIPSEDIKKRVAASYSGFQERLAADQDPAYWSLFDGQLRALNEKGIEVILFIPPYHPDFKMKFDIEFPQYAAQSKAWITRLNSMSSEKIRVLNYFEGIPGDDKGPSFWDDGMHMTCKSAIIMLEKSLRER